MSVEKPSNLLTKYSALYDKKPKSRVFAPLAETYRAMGMYDDALKILRKGLKFHPTYTLAYIVLGNIYFDKGQFELAYSTLKPFVSENLDNVKLQKLFAKSSLSLGILEEALDAYKYLLLLNPRDEFVAEKVNKLEKELFTGLKENNNIEEDYVEPFGDESSWVQVDFNKRNRESVSIEQFKNDIENNNFDISDINIEDDFYKQDFDNEQESVIDIGEPSEPIVTHTLVDLYLEQGYRQKAVEVLESILKLHPHDEASRNKLNKINSGVDALPKDSPKDMQLDKLQALESKLKTFVDTLKANALKKQFNL